MAGSPPAIPALLGVANRMSVAEVSATIKNGKGRMPGFATLSAEQLSGLPAYVMSGVTKSYDKKEIPGSVPASPAMRYHFTGYRRFLDPEGYPAIAPPWGTLNALNLNTGEYVWKIP